jgi:hypothetical protein
MLKALNLNFVNNMIVTQEEYNGDDIDVGCVIIRVGPGSGLGEPGPPRSGPEARCQNI